MADSLLSLRSLLDKSKNKKGYSTNIVDDKWKSLRELKSLLDDQVEFRNKSNSSCTGHNPNLTLPNLDLKSLSETIDQVVPCSCNSVSTKACNCVSRTGEATCTCYNYTCNCVSRGPGISCDCVSRTGEATCTCYNQTCGCQNRTTAPVCSCNIVCSGKVEYGHGNCTCNGANPSNCDHVGVTCWCNLDGGTTCYCVSWYTEKYGSNSYHASTNSFMDTSCYCAFRNPIELGCSCHVASGSLGCGCHQRTATPYACICNYECSCQNRTSTPACFCVSRGSITCTCNTECTCQGRTSAPSCPCNVVCNCDIQDTFNN